MRVGYCKLGRSLKFTKKHGFQGDAEGPNLLFRLAARNPDVEWVLCGRNDAMQETFRDYPNVTNLWLGRSGVSGGLSSKLSVVMGTLDGIVVQVGQHGTSHRSIPQSGSTWAQYYEDPETHATTPYDWAATYADYLIQGMNLLGDRSDGTKPVIYLVSDPRNYIFARDIKWPTGLDHILSQYAYTREQRHERWRDPRSPDAFGERVASQVVKVDRGGEVWVVRHRHEYADLELMILPDDWQSWGQVPWEDRQDVGVASTSFAVSGPPGWDAAKAPRRSELIRDYVLSGWPDAEVFGKWDEGSLADVPPGTVVQNDPVDFPDLLARWRSTIATPALGTPWTVAKPYQCWAARTVCFMIGNLDDQGWVLPSRRRPKEREGVVMYALPNGFFSVRDDWTDDELTLAQWLRVETPDELHARVKQVATDRDTWLWLVTTQRALLQRRWDAHLLESTIEHRLGITTSPRITESRTIDA